MPKQPMGHGQAVLLMVLATLMWSTAGVVTRQLESAPAFESTFWRAFFTFVSLLVILPLWQGRGVWGRIARSGSALWLSGVCWAVMFTAFPLCSTRWRTPCMASSSRSRPCTPPSKKTASRCTSTHGLE